MVPAAVHAVEDKEDVEDDHLDDHMDEGNFNEDVMDEGYQQAEHDLQARGQLEEPHTPKVSESHLKKRKVFKCNL